MHVLSRKVEQQDSCTSKGRPLAFMTATSLCPLIWIYIILMLVVFIRKVALHCTSCLALLLRQLLQRSLAEPKPAA